MPEAGRRRGRQPNRFTVHRVQLRGRPGAVLATDAVMACRHAGLTARVVAPDEPGAAAHDRVTSLAVHLHPDAIVAPAVGPAIARPESS